MSNNVAFRFLGKMAEECSNICYNAATGNIPMLALDVGLKVLELTESVITYGEEKKRTIELKKQIDYMKKNIDKTIEAEKEKAEKSLFLLNEKLNEDLKLEKAKLTKEIDEYRKLVELNMDSLNYRYKEQNSIDHLVIKSARRYKEILNKIEECITIQSKNAADRNNVNYLYEEFRKTQILYNRLIETIN